MSKSKCDRCEMPTEDQYLTHVQGEGEVCLWCREVEAKGSTETSIEDYSKEEDLYELGDYRSNY